MAKSMHDEIKELIKENYSSLSEYARLIGVDPKSLQTLLQRSRNLQKLGGDKYLAYLGPLNLDTDAFFRDGVVKKRMPDQEGSADGRPAVRFYRGKGVECFDIGRAIHGDFLIVEQRLYTDQVRYSDWVQEVKYLDAPPVPGTLCAAVNNGVITTGLYAEGPEGPVIIEQLSEKRIPAGINSGVKIIGKII